MIWMMKECYILCQDNTLLPSNYALPMHGELTSGILVGT